MLAIILLTFTGVCVSFGGTVSNTGCGLGTVLFKDQDGLLSQTCAITTNGSTYNQFFGITSGTLECDQAESLVSVEKINIFVADNMDNLAKDIAKGDGEYLDTLANLMGTSQAERQDLFKELRRNFAVIYSSDEITHADVVTKIFGIKNS